MSKVGVSPQETLIGGDVEVLEILIHKEISTLPKIQRSGGEFLYLINLIMLPNKGTGN